MGSTKKDVVSFLAREKRDTLLGILGAGLALAAGIPLPLTIIAGIVLLLLVVGLAREVRMAVRLHAKKRIPVAVVAGRSDEEFTAMLGDVLASMKKWEFDERRFDSDFNLDRDHWVVRRESDLSTDTQEWVSLVHRFEGKVIRVSAKLKGTKIFHLFLNCPVALAFGLGAVLGTKYEVVLNHFQKSPDGLPYTPVIDLATAAKTSEFGAHLLKTKVSEPYRYITVKWPDKMGELVAVSLDFVYHGTLADVQREAVKRGLPVVYVNNALGSTLPLNADWILAAREIATVIGNVVLQPEVKRVEIFQGCIVPLGFAVGMALGTQSPIDIKHWFARDNQYQTVLSLEKLRQPR